VTRRRWLRSFAAGSEITPTGVAVGERLPLAVLMSGAPGSGKSTLAAALGERLRLPVVHKDRLREGRLCTTGAGPISHEDVDRLHARWAAPGAFGPELFYRTMETWLGLGVSAIGDHTLERGPSEPDVASRLAPLAVILNVHCRTPLAVERFQARVDADPIHVTPYGDALLATIRRLQAELFEPLDLGCPALIVDTTQGLRPSLEEIASWVCQTYAAASPR
jgi:predicted kinase